MDMGLNCASCHETPRPGEMMGIPAASKCMTCHQTVRKDSPAIQKLAAFAARQEPVPWVRVYQIPSFVFFSHKWHLAAGAKCETCHGKVAERDRMFRETDISMGGFQIYHREHKSTLHSLTSHHHR